jgi:hypothetical protein
MIFPLAAALTDEDDIPMPIIFIFVAIPASCPTTQEVRCSCFLLFILVSLGSPWNLSYFVFCSKFC